MTRREQAFFILILLLAAVVRMSWPGLTEFKADEARLLKLAYEMAEGGGMALRGIGSSVGFPNFPMSVWLYALPSWLSLHPYAATIFTGLLNTIAAVGCFWLVRRYWGTQAGLLAMLLIAVSPWAILYSRKIWAQNLLPLFVMGWGISAALAFVERRRRFLWLHLLCLAIVVQIHLAAIALVPATAVLLIIFWRRIAWRDLLVGGGLGLLTAVPFLIYLNRDGFFTRLFANSLGTDGGAASEVAWSDALRFVWLLSTGREIHSLAGPVAFESFLAQVPDLGAIHLVWTLLILLGIGIAMNSAWRNWQEPSSQVGLIVLVWLLVPTLFFTIWRSSPIFLHYFIATLPAQFILLAIGVNWLVQQSWLQEGTRTAVWGGLVIAALLQLYIWLALFNFIANNPTPGGFGTSLAQKLSVAEQARQLMADSEATEILIAGAGENPLTAEFAAVYDTLLHKAPRRFVDVTRSALYPAETAVLLHDGQQRATSYGLRLPVGAVFAENLPSFVELLPGNSAPIPEHVVEPVPIWTNWVSLAGYSGPVINSGQADWRLHWHTGANPDPSDYHFFNHLLDANDQRLSQADAALFAPSQWREGDVVVSHFTLPWSDAAATMRVGIYRYPSQENVQIFDVAGNPYAPAIELPITPK